ncbi:MAG: S41 family peptidase [Verrucomicrobiota bacterium]|nr:S41 family peptidase [Verrucomicrobiota bacterium]
MLQTKAAGKIVHGTVLGLLLLNLAIGAKVYSESDANSAANDPHANLDLFVNVLERIRQDYVDGGELTYEDLVHGALRGMIGMLDPHSEFMPPVRYSDVMDDAEGKFGGVGVHINIQDGYLTVLAPMEDTPAYEAGVMSGDRIVRIEGKNARNISMPEAIDKLRGKPGSKVKMTLFRPSTRKDIEVTLKRALIKVATVKDINNERKFIVDEDKIGYVRLTQFGESTAGDLEEALRKLEVEGMKGLVLDLRHNPGGLLEQAIRVSEKFLAKGEPIVTTEGRRENEKRESSGRNARPELPVVVLVNRFSASASEIVAGCLKDNDRARIVGEKTFGKGSVQRILPINGQHGAALRLTTAKYYTPSHEVIHGKGIKPHHDVKLSREEEELLFLQRTPGGLKMVSDDRREAVEKFIDPQLAKAVELLTGKKQLQAKAEPKEEKPAEKPEKPAEKSKPKEAPKKESKPEKKPEPKPDDKPKDEAKEKDEPVDKPE